MTSEADANGWAVRDEDGNINVSTVSATPIGAMVNWLGAHMIMGALNNIPADQIESFFNRMCGRAKLVKVAVIEIDR